MIVSRKVYYEGSSINIIQSSITLGELTLEEPGFIDKMRTV